MCFIVRFSSRRDLRPHYCLECRNDLLDSVGPHDLDQFFVGQDCGERLWRHWCPPSHRRCEQNVTALDCAALLVIQAQHLANIGWIGAGQRRSLSCCRLDQAGPAADKATASRARLVGESRPRASPRPDMVLPNSSNCSIAEVSIEPRFRGSDAATCDPFPSVVGPGFHDGFSGGGARNSEFSCLCLGV